MCIAEVLVSAIYSLLLLYLGSESRPYLRPIWLYSTSNLLNSRGMEEGQLQAMERIPVEIHQDAEELSIAVANEIAALIRERAAQGVHLQCPLRPANAFELISFQMMCTELLSAAPTT